MVPCFSLFLGIFQAISGRGLEKKVQEERRNEPRCRGTPKGDTQKPVWVWEELS